MFASTKPQLSCWGSFYLKHTLMMNRGPQGDPECVKIPTQ
nr:MAG TPA: hypothetical protein [Caudoviricetes sp.]